MNLHTWLLRPLPLALLVAFAALFALPEVCAACSCATTKTPTEALAEADAVFRGAIISIERVTDAQGRLYQSVTVRVTTVWKGTVSAETTLYTGSGMGDCGYGFQQGEEYLIYAPTIKSAQALPPAPLGTLTTSVCDRTRPISQATGDFAALGAGQPPTPGLPNTGTGTLGTPSERMIPGELLIGGAILAFLAAVQTSQREDRDAPG